MVPLTGLEPVRSCDQGILSPWCLPIPPQRHIKFVYEPAAHVPLSVCGSLRMSSAIRPSSLADRCTHCAFALPAPGGAKARGQARTGTVLRPRDFKSLVSTNSPDCGARQLRRRRCAFLICRPLLTLRLPLPPPLAAGKLAATTAY